MGKITDIEKAKKLEKILAELRSMRNSEKIPFRSDFNAACDRIDVVISKLYQRENNGKKRMIVWSYRINVLDQKSFERYIKKHNIARKIK